MVFGHKIIINFIATKQTYCLQLQISKPPIMTIKNSVDNFFII